MTGVFFEVSYSNENHPLSFIILEDDFVRKSFKKLQLEFILFLPEVNFYEMVLGMLSQMKQVIEIVNSFYKQLDGQKCSNYNIF